MSRILIIEDDEAIRSLVRMTLEMDQHLVTEASDGIEGLRQLENMAAENLPPDLILLDIMLPGLDGYEVLRRIQDREIPVIFMTAKTSVTDRVFGLKLGADDYIAKPFEPMELLARVEAHLRARDRYRTKPADAAEEEIRFEDMIIRPSERSVSKSGKPIPLTAKEYDLLITLLSHRNKVLSREQLLELVWGFDYLGGTRTVDMHVAQLRQKLGLQESLETVYKVGYILRGKRAST